MLLGTPDEYKLILFIFCSITLTIILTYYKIKERRMNRDIEDFNNSSKKKILIKKLIKGN